MYPQDLLLGHKYVALQFSDTVAKWLKHSTVDQKVPGSNPTCCFTDKAFSSPLLPLEEQPLAERAWR